MKYFSFLLIISTLIFASENIDYFHEIEKFEKEKQFDKAFETMKQGANNGDQISQLLYAEDFEKKKSISDSIYWYKKSLQGTSNVFRSFAQFALYKIYKNELNNDAIASSMLNKAALNGLINAQVVLAKYYNPFAIDTIAGIEKDKSKQIKWLERAALQEDNLKTYENKSNLISTLLIIYLGGDKYIGDYKDFVNY